MRVRRKGVVGGLPVGAPIVQRKFSCSPSLPTLHRNKEGREFDQQSAQVKGKAREIGNGGGGFANQFYIARSPTSSTRTMVGPCV